MAATAAIPQSSPERVLELSGVSRILPGPLPVTLVADIDLRVAAGDFLAIPGPSGSGKSSLLYLLGLLDRPTEGEVLLQGRPTSELSDRERSRLRIGQLPGNLSEAVTALEKDDVIKSALGEHIAGHFIEAKKQEWGEYIAQVHEWELQRYLGTY